MEKKHNTVDFIYKNRNKGHAIILPQMKNQDGFMVQAKGTNGLKACYSMWQMLMKNTVKMIQLSGSHIIWEKSMMDHSHLLQRLLACLWCNV